MGCFSSLESQRKGGSGDSFSGLSRVKLPLPIFPVAASFMGTIGVYEIYACQGRERKRSCRHVLQRESMLTHGSFISMLLIYKYLGIIPATFQ